MSLNDRTQAQKPANRPLIEALVAFGAFCALSLLSFRVPLALHLMVISGLALPLVWGKLRGDWKAMGFTKRDLGPALLWGLGAGAATSLMAFVSLPERKPPPELGLELAIGIPLLLLLASPFQEFFFRGWLQPRFEHRLGKSLGLLAATACFTLWHYCWPLSDASSFPLNTLGGLAATFAAGLIYGYSFQRTRSIVAPWLAHALNGIMFVILGAGSFVGALA